MSDNSNNVHFSGVRFICSPYLAIKLALALLGLIMARCGLQMNLTPSKWTLLLYYFNSKPGGVCVFWSHSQFKTRWCLCALMKFSKTFSCFEKWKQRYFNSKQGGVCVFWSHSQKGFLVWKMKAMLFQFKTRWCLCVFITFSKRFFCFEKWKQCCFNSKLGGFCMFWLRSEKGFLGLKNESNVISIQYQVVFVCFDQILKKLFLFWKMKANIISIQNQVVFVCFDHTLKKVFWFWNIAALIRKFFDLVQHN